jgi:glycyl-tRNA synthetase
MDTTLEKIVALCKRRGFAYPSSDIYGGMANAWDFGPMGTLLKNNIRDQWWKHFVLTRDDMVGLDASVFLNPKAWEASGHVAGFTDAMVDCRTCHTRTRADHLIEDFLTDTQVEGKSLEELDAIINKHQIPCPRCSAFDWTPVRAFNLLFETQVGILEGSKSKAYLRGEIAQGIFLNFKNVLQSTRVKVPFGIAQTGKAFRNEITMGQFLHRTLEFDLMEFEYFIHPDTWKETFAYWQERMWGWALSLGISKEHLRVREHSDQERSHYSSRTIDIEYHYPFGWKEMFGLAYRSDFDLKNHAEHSGKDLSYLDQETGAAYIPHVIEPTFGLSRLTGIVLFDAYREIRDGEKTRIILSLAPSIAPIKTAVFPLLANKPDLIQKAREVYHFCQEHIDGKVAWDDRGNIGKRYASQDEVGTPYCLTIDFQSLEDDTITLRHRDTAQQERIAIADIPTRLSFA